MRLDIIVEGRPAPGGSKSGYINKRSGKIIIAPASKYTKPWMELVTSAAKEAHQGELLECAISLTVIFKLSRPKNHWRVNGELSKAGLGRPHPTVEPDLTKLLRSTEDALTGILWKDDAQVVRQGTSKRYCRYGELPGVEIIVEEVAYYE